MKKFFGEFKKFIARGNVMDLAVGMIIGSAFTAIVTALSNGILKPIINMVLYYCFGGDSKALSKMYSMLVPVYTQQEVLDAAGASTGKFETVIDLTNSIYIDWGALISAIINFLLIAIVLFLIVRAFNRIKDVNANITNEMKRIEFKQKNNLKLSKKETKILEKEKARLALEEEKKKALLEEQAKANQPDPVVVLLEEIRDQLKENK